MKNTRTVTSFFDKEYLDYARYVVENRAIPSCIDGLKPTQRKVVYIANKIWKTGNEKPMKLFQLAGRVASEAFYHHGNTSLESSMVGMAQKFKNSLPLLEGVGQFGSLRSPAAGAPRYISAKLHPNFRLLYQDFDLLENKIEEGEKIEPAFFLPIVPTVILNGTSGIAVGFATNILNRNPKDVVDACISTLNNKKMKVLAPWIQEFKGTFTRDLENPKTWKIKGQYQIINTTTVKITAIPPNYTYERYEEILNLLQEKGIITSYDDNSSETIEYILKFRRSVLNSLVSSEGKLERALRLNTQETENLTTLDENGKLKIFDKAEDIVKHFVGVRLGWYQTRKDYLIDKTEKQLSLVTNKARFIKDIIDGKLKINNVPKKTIILYLETADYDTVHGSYDYLLSMAIHSLTKERYEKLLLEKEGCIIALKTLK
ncbi:MAG: DNA gyrase subunit A, partial [Candidatus Pelagibacterales bacterium]